MTAASSPRGRRAFEAAVLQERQAAMRLLLSKPLLTAAANPQQLLLVRRHAQWLSEWLARNTHWQLHVDSELARLRKRPADVSDPTRPARNPSNHQAFTRRRYVMLCLALAMLERAERQTVLGQMAAGIMGFASSDPALREAGIDLDLTQHEQRRDLVQIVKLLIALGVLIQIDGDEEHYLANTGDVLYTVQRAALTSLLDVRRGPSTIDAGDFDARLAMLLHDSLPDSDEARNRRIRASLTARLLDDPVLYFDELTEAERVYLSSQRPHLLREIETATGLVPEVRREGIAMADSTGDATDQSIAESGTDGHLALLLAEWLASEARQSEAATSVGLATIHQKTAELIAAYGSWWRKEAREPGAEVELARQALDTLESLRLIRRVDDAVVVRPAIGRYALDPSNQPPAENQGALWKSSS